MAEQFGVAALRHLESAELLELNGRAEDAGYHYGVAGEAAIKESLQRASIVITRDLRKHINDRSGPLQINVEAACHVLAVLSSGHLGGLATDLATPGTLPARFKGWSLDIRYADTSFPVGESELAAWKADAVHLVNAGAF